MADADEKLTALKKAYADIILGISKEAAARVMASERKSVGYQYELKVAKEEGLRMMFRLKQMMDFQNTEAETASLNQQKKIEELEAQLQEAEDIVSDLRQELREAHAELERVKDVNSHHVNESATAYSDKIPEENKIYSYNESSDVMVPHRNTSSECRKCSSKIVCACSGYNRVLPSIIRGKERGLYRKGCTQRIRACERNLSEEIDKVKEKNNGGEKEKSKSTSKKPVSEAKSELEKKLFAGIKLGKIQSFPQRRKRANRLRKTAIPLGAERSSKPDWMPKHSVTSGSISVKENASSNENNCSKTCPSLSANKFEPQSQLGCAEASNKIRNLAKICVAEAMENDDGADEKMDSLKKVTEVSEGLLSLNYKTDIEKVDVKGSHSLESNISTQTVIRDIVIKYTFQRKRKRQALSGSEACGSIGTENKMGEGQNGDKKMEQPKHSLLMESSSGSIEMEKKMGEGQNGNKKMEQTKRSLLMDSSRESRRLAQVARQLISLSEKKW